MPRRACVSDDQVVLIFARRSLGETQRAIAAAVGVSTFTVGKVLRSAKPYQGAAELYARRRELVERSWRRVQARRAGGERV